MRKFCLFFFPDKENEPKTDGDKKPSKPVPEFKQDFSHEYIDLRSTWSK